MSDTHPSCWFEEIDDDDDDDVCMEAEARTGCGCEQQGAVNYDPRSSLSQLETRA